jgi:hypothetical protein
MNGEANCGDRSDEKYQSNKNLETTIAFQIMCDGYIEVRPIMINGRNETDETECADSHLIILIHDVMVSGIAEIVLMKSTVNGHQHVLHFIIFVFHQYSVISHVYTLNM